jgi:hypothetical protein
LTTKKIFFVKRLRMSIFCCTFAVGFRTGAEVQAVMFIQSNETQSFGVIFTAATIEGDYSVRTIGR